MKKMLIIAMSALILFNAQAQDIYTKDSLVQQLDSIASIDTRNLVSAGALNLFFQKRLATYFSGTDALTFYKGYFNYNNADDKLTLGYNAAVPNVGKAEKKNKYVYLVLNPFIQFDVKDNFATLLKKQEWQDNINMGFKISGIFKGKIKYDSIITNTSQKGKLAIKRLQAKREILDKIRSDSNALAIAHRNIQSDLNNLPGNNQAYNELTDPINDSTFWHDKATIYINEFVEKEEAELEKKGAYNSFKAYWFSLWGNWGLRKSAYLVTPDTAHLIAKIKKYPWEINLNFNILYSRCIWTLLITPEYSAFRNNSVKASLLTEITADQYIKLPNTAVDTFNIAIINDNSNKAYLGEFKAFTTHNIKLNIVNTFAIHQQFSIGLRVKLEKLFGDQDPLKLTIGVPIKVQGKEQAINIEPQVLFKNMINKTGADNFKQNPVFGINVGIPFVSLYK